MASPTVCFPALRDAWSESLVKRPFSVRTRASFWFGIAAASAGALWSACCKGRPPENKAPEEAQVLALVPVEESDVSTRIWRDPGRPRGVIWIGLDGLDWELLDSLSAQGQLPNWKRLTESGFTADLESFRPMLSPIVWTTLATGVGPDIHGVLDFQEVDSKTGAKVPISGTSRQAPAIWNIASRAGKKVGVVGWWGTHPAEEVNGFLVTDRARPILFEDTPRSGVAFPVNLAPVVGEVVRRDGRIAPPDLAPFLDVPQKEISEALASGQGMENPVVALARVVSSTRVYHRLARELYDRNAPDLLMVYFEGTDEIAHLFAPYSEPKLGCVSDADYGRYRRVIPAYYKLVDRMLGQWMRRAQEDDAVLIVNSDHGFKWGADRPCERPSSGPATAAYWHRQQGVLVASGRGLAPAPTRAQTTVFDLAPTVLALLGIRSHPKMPGRPVAAFPLPVKLESDDSWFSSGVRRVAAEAPSASQTAEYTRELIALGYLSGGEKATIASAGGTRPGWTEGAWNNLGLYYRDTRKDPDAARSAFREALKIRPDYASPMFNLAVVERSRGRWGEALEHLFRSFAAGHPAPERTILQWAWFASGEHRPAIAISLLERGIAAYPRSEEIARELGRRRFEKNDCEGAINVLEPFAAGVNRDTLNLLGLSQLCLGRRDAALGLLQRSLSLDPAQPSVQEAVAFIRREAKQ